MKTLTRSLLAILLFAGFPWAQLHSEDKPTQHAGGSSVSCGMDRDELQVEMKELNLHTSRMESRIVMIRNSAGTIQDPQVRNALQVDADMWQDEVDYLHQYAERLKTVADRCEAQEKIRESTK